MAKSVLLIVVDDPAHRALFNKHLGSTSHSLVFASDGEEAFDRFGEAKPDLVIAHLHVARIDGTILCQLIRNEPTGNEVPIVLVGEELIDPSVAAMRIKHVGADAFLPIPFSKQLLARCITPLLAFGRPSEDEPVPPTWEDADPPTAPTPDIDEAEVAAAESGDIDDTPIPRRPNRREDADLDTVVSMQNPFYRTDDDDDDDTGDFASSPVTDVHDDRAPLESARALADPAERNPRAILSSEESPTGRNLIDPYHSDPLAEPRIDTARRTDRPTNSDLIQEPMREKTPSRSDEHRMGSARPTPRRGLDESQLGKRLAKRVRSMHRQLGTIDYYQLLGLEKSATAQQITAAYFEHSLEFHPDRFFLLRSGDLKEKIYEIYRHVGQAYRVLSDPRAREKYDADRAAGVEPEAPPEAARSFEPAKKNGIEIATKTPEAERFVHLAGDALAEGDLNAARLHLHLALTYERGNAALADAIAQVAEQQKRNAP